MNFRSEVAVGCRHEQTPPLVERRWVREREQEWFARTLACECCGGPRIRDDFDEYGRPVNTGLCSFCRVR